MVTRSEKHEILQTVNIIWSILLPNYLQLSSKCQWWQRSSHLNITLTLPHAVYSANDHTITLQSTAVEIKKRLERDRAMEELRAGPIHGPLPFMVNMVLSPLCLFGA